MTTHLHLPELEQLLVRVEQIAPAFSEFVTAFGICPSALQRVSEACAHQALVAVADGVDGFPKAIEKSYLCGVLLGLAISDPDGTIAPPTNVVPLRPKPCAVATIGAA